MANLFAEDENMMVYVDVDPLIADVIEDNKNTAVNSAEQAAQSAAEARTSLATLEDYKTGLELFYAEARNGITDLFNECITNINNLLQRALTEIRTLGESLITRIQGYINQVQETIDNNISSDLLNSSKAMMTGSVAACPTVIADVIKYAHSTFDISKFTSLIHGTPLITSDGLMYGNYDNSVASGLEMPTTLLVPNVENRIRLKYTYKKANISGHTQVLLNIRFDNTTNNFNISASESGNLGTAVNGTNAGTFADIVEGQSYIVDVVSDYKSYFKIYVDGVEKYSDTTLNLTYTTCSMFRIGGNSSWQSTRYSVGAIDLKYLEVENNGKPVFSGNKTGIDTIKSDDYTVTGTPTISADGIASGFSSSNFLSTSIAETYDITSHTYTFRAKYIYATGGSGVIARLGRFWIVFESGHIRLQGQDADNNAKNFVNATIPTPENGDEYIITGSLGLSGTVRSLSVSINGGTPIVGTDTAYNPNTGSQTNTNIWIGINNTSTPLSAGYVDLNEIHLYKDTSLIYQPCLKLPCTESKTGSKVVNSIYRDRVNDMAEQFGYAPYYTLSDTDFTLPHGEIYGMMEKLINKAVSQINQS